MGQNPFEKDILKAEKALSAQLGKHLTTCLRAKDVQKKADAATNSSSTGKVPPKPVLSVFESALKKTLKSLPKKFSGCEHSVDVTYVQKGTSWIASATASVRFKMLSVGGATVKVQPGDTLWDISRAKYGHGMYWPAIASANPAKVKSKGDFILAGCKLHVPQIQVPEPTVAEDVAKQASRPTKASLRPAACVLYPALELSFEKGKSMTTIIKSPTMIIRITVTMKGTLKAQKEGTIQGASFDMGAYETELTNGMKPFETSFKIKNLGLDAFTVSSDVSGTAWKSSVSLKKDLSAKFSMSSRPVKFTHKKIHYQGSVGLDITIQYIPKLRPPVPIYERVFDEVRDFVVDKGKAVAGTVLIVAAGAIVVITVVEDFAPVGGGVANDPASFSAASALYGTGRALVF